MKAHPLTVLLLAAAAFLGLYAAGQADEPGDEPAALKPPTALQSRAGEGLAVPPRLGRAGELPNLRPARRREPASEPEPQEEETDTASEPVPPTPVAPVPAPPPAPAPQPEPPSGGGGGGGGDSGGGGGGKPFYTDG